MPSRDLQETFEHIQAIARLALAVSVEDAQAVAAEIERTDTVLPFTDPTAWAAMQNTLPSHRAVINGFISFRSAIERALEKEARR